MNAAAAATMAAPPTINGSLGWARMRSRIGGRPLLPGAGMSPVGTAVLMGAPGTRPMSRDGPKPWWERDFGIESSFRRAGEVVHGLFVSQRLSTEHANSNGRTAGVFALS